jgi:hypothetical protein
MATQIPTFTSLQPITQGMAELLDLTGMDSGNEAKQGGVDDIGQSMIRAGTKPHSASEANRANTYNDNLGRQVANTPLAPPTVCPHRPIPHCNPPLLDDNPDIVKPVDWSRVKTFRKWEFDP